MSQSATAVPRGFTRTICETVQVVGEPSEFRTGNLGYGGCMKIKQIIAVMIMLAGAACFWLDSADRSQADWKIDALGILLVLFGLWVGKFNFKRTK
jgi:hypothetical protein